MLPLTTAVDVLSDYPELVVLLAIATRAARAWQTQLTWSEYRLIHRFKRGVLPLVDRLPVVGSAVLWVSDKGGRDDAEYETTVRGSIRETVGTLQDAGASLHLINSIKRRPDTHGDPLTGAHVIWTVSGTGDQIEGYLFRNDDGTVDVYAHTETSIDDPLGHLTDTQTDGDAHDVVPELGEKEATA